MKKSNKFKKELKTLLDKQRELEYLANDSDLEDFEDAERLEYYDSLELLQDVALSSLSEVGCNVYDLSVSYLESYLKELGHVVKVNYSGGTSVYFDCDEFQVRLANHDPKYDSHEHDEVHYVGFPDSQSDWNTNLLKFEL